MASSPAEGTPPGDDVVVGEEPDYEEKLDEAPRSILMGMIKQLKVGMDLSRITLPAFILEPRSFLEKCSDFMSHGHHLLDLCNTPEPTQRMLSVVRWYLSSWHLKPPGVKKPYNPILGEVFHCKWEYGDQDKGSTYFFAEQVSHHPPVSSFFFVNRKRNWSMNVSLRPKSKFLGNSAASIMEGEGYLHLSNYGEVYKITFPAYYVRGILIGVMRMEISGDVAISCEQTGLTMELSFKNRGYFSGENNSVDGKIKNTRETLYKIEEHSELERNPVVGTIGRTQPCLLTLAGADKRTKQTEVLFDIDEKRKYFTPPIVTPEAKQKYCESRRVWSLVSQALRAQNIDLATDEKLKLEDGQRAGKKERDEAGRVWEGSTWSPRLFDNLNPSDAKSLNWRFKLCKTTPYEGEVESEARWEADVLALVAQGELAVGRSLMASLNPGGA